MKLKYNVVLVALLCGIAAYSATKGDQQPQLLIGTVNCPADGGSAQIPLLPNQNAIALRNFLTDGGTAKTVYVSTDAGITAKTGFPIKDQEVLSIDVVALTTNAVMTSGGPFPDGGTQITPGALQPKLYCSTTLADFVAQELHYILVK